MSPTAIEKLQPSVLSDQMEALGGDVDLVELNLVLPGLAPLDIRGMMTGGTVMRTIEGSSTITIPVHDTNRALLRSAFLQKRSDVRIDGLWFRLITTDSGGGLSDRNLVFEDREVAVLRTYPKPGAKNKGYLVRNANKVTRVEFARLLVREVKEFARPIRFVCPALGKLNLTRAADLKSGDAKRVERALGFPPGVKVKVKTADADADQLRNIAAIIDTGLSMKVARKVLVLAIMVATQESNMRTTATNGNGKYVGLFQQDSAPGSAWRIIGGGTRDPVADARAFFIEAVKAFAARPADTYEDLGETIQRPGDGGPGNQYGQWRTQAEQTVTAYGVPGKDRSTADDVWGTNGSNGLVLGENAFQFVRGTVTNENGQRRFTREDNWDCLGRLADEVNWRRFCVSGAVYFISEVDLFRSAPQMTLSPETDGVLAIGDAYTVGKRDATLTLTVRIDRWAAPPGTTVVIKDMGLLDGRWLVSTISRPLFTSTATITLVKPRPVIPESESPEFKTNQTGPTVLQNSGDKAPDATGQTFRAGGSLIAPVPKSALTSRGGLHNTSGSSNGVYMAGDAWGKTATDFFAPAGSPVLAVENGKIARFSGHDPSEGAVLGAGGPLGWSIYLQGDSGTVYYYTHLNTRTVVVGQTVTIGQQIATIADYKSFGRADHVHVGLHLGPVTGQMLHDAPAAVTA